MKIKNLIATILTFMLMLTAITGCTQGTTSPENTIIPTEAASASVDADAAEKPLINGSEGIKPYGQLVDVKGKKMNIYTVGEGDKTIVWIPGYAEISSRINYHKMLDELSPDYRVVVVEPFGYGLSDISGEERTIENMVEEIHEGVNQVVDGEQYILMAHSISGIYGMKYASDYADEVIGFIGLDSSTPSMFDERIIRTEHVTLEQLKEMSNPNWSDEMNKQYQLIAEKVLSNPDVLNEDEHMSENAIKAKAYPFRADLPVCFFLAKESIENRKFFPGESNDWVKMHTDLLEDVKYSKIHEIDSHHLLFDTHPKEITELINEFVAGIPQ